MVSPRMKQEVCVTLSVEDWAKVIAAIAKSPLPLSDKEELNSVIYDSVIDQDFGKYT